MSAPVFLNRPGLVVTPIGGRPPKTARDVAVLLALEWFNAGAPAGRQKLRDQVVDLWATRGYPGLTDPAHVTARASKARKVLGGAKLDAVLLTFKGEVDKAGAGVVLAPAGSATEADGRVDFHGPVWCWTHGAETAEWFETVGILEYGPKRI